MWFLPRSGAETLKVLKQAAGGRKFRLPAISMNLADWTRGDLIYPCRKTILHHPGRA